MDVENVSHKDYDKDAKTAKYGGIVCAVAGLLGIIGLMFYQTAALGAVSGALLGSGFTLLTMSYFISHNVINTTKLDGMDKKIDDLKSDVTKTVENFDQTQKNENMKNEIKLLQDELAHLKKELTKSKKKKSKN